MESRKSKNLRAAGRHSDCGLRIANCGLQLSLAFLCLLLSLVSSQACSVPVFRYALERWPASPYELVVFNRGKLMESQGALLARFAADSTSGPPANVTVRVVDLSANPPDQMVQLWERQKPDTLPALVLRYPEGPMAQAAIWSGPLSAETVGQVVDSPVRRRLAQRLLKGDCAVWLLLESGDKLRDDDAARLLQTRLEHLQKTLELPKLEAEDVANRVIATPESELKVAFSSLRLARHDPAEQLFVRTLLASEEDLGAAKEPIAFPVFGRGRLLGALVGKGINQENIDEACSFLTGPCSCVVKEENPGLDLLLAADWDNQVRAETTAEPAPELTSLASFAAKPDSATPAAAPATLVEAKSNAPLPAAADAPAPLSNAGGFRALRVSVLMVITVGGLVFVAGIVLLLRPKR